MNRAAIARLEQAIEDLKGSAGFRATETADLDSIMSKFKEAFDELKTLRGEEIESPGRREAREVGFQQEAQTEDKTEDKTDDEDKTVAQSFEQAADIARERLRAAA